MTKIVILSGGLGYTQLPLIGFCEQYEPNNTSTMNEILSEYNSIQVEFGINWGAGGEGQVSIDTQSGRFSGSGNLVDMANYFKGYGAYGYDISITGKMNYKWLSLDIKSNVTMGPILHGGSNETIPKTLDENLYFFRASPTDGTILDSYTKTLLKTISENGGPNLLKENDTKITRQPTYNELRKPLIKCINDNMKFLYDQSLNTDNDPKIIFSWNSVIMPSPLYSTSFIQFKGWFLNPPEFDSNKNMTSGIDSPNKRAFNRRLITGEDVYILNNDTNNEKYLSLSNDDWDKSHENRAIDSLYQRCLNVKPISSNSLCNVMANQFFSPLYSRSLQDIVGNDISIDSDIDDLVMAGEQNLFQEREKVADAIYKSFRLNWIVQWKTYGNKASAELELYMDKTVPDNIHWGLATSHIDFKNYFLKPMFDPITQEESIKHNLPIGLIMQPKQIVFWTALGFYLQGVFGNSNENNTNEYACYLTNRTYARSNILTRFPPPNNVSLTWVRGSQYHRHVCEKLEEFGIERCKTVKQFTDENKYKGISTESKISILKQKIQDFIKENN